MDYVGHKFEVAEQTAHWLKSASVTAALLKTTNRNLSRSFGGRAHVWYKRGGLRHCADISGKLNVEFIPRILVNHQSSK